MRERVVRKEPRPRGEVPEDRVRLDQRPSVCELEDGRRAVRVQPCVVVGERAAVEDVDRHPVVRKRELSEQESNLVAIG